MLCANTNPHLGFEFWAVDYRKGSRGHSLSVRGIHSANVIASNERPPHTTTWPWETLEDTLKYFTDKVQSVMRDFYVSSILRKKKKGIYFFCIRRWFGCYGMWFHLKGMFTLLVMYLERRKWEASFSFSWKIISESYIISKMIQFLPGNIQWLHNGAVIVAYFFMERKAS